MSFRLALAEIYLPRFLRKRELDRLFNMTGRAFEADLPPLRGLSPDASLEVFARWTAGLAAAAAKGGRAAAAKERLRSFSIGFGRRIGAMLGVRSRKDAMRAARLLYRFLGIDFLGADSGEIIIRRCSFSEHYTPETCALMSGLDEGVLAGLAGGGRLTFQARLTEGRDSCRARFAFPESLS